MSVAELPESLLTVRHVELLPDDELAALVAPCEVLVQEGLKVFALPVRPVRGTADLVLLFGARATFGVWGVRSVEDAQWAVAQQPAFVLVDVPDPAVADVIRAAGVVLLLAGCTPNETLTAWGQGCSGVQVWPTQLVRRGGAAAYSSAAAGVPLVARGAMTSEALTEWVRAGVVAVCPQPGLIEAASKDDLAVLRSRCRTIGESLGQGN